MRNFLSLFIFLFFFFISLPFVKSIAAGVNHETRGLDEQKINQLRKSGEFDYILQMDDSEGFWDPVGKFFSKLFQFGYNDQSEGVWTFVFYMVLGLFVVYIVWKWVRADKTWFLKQKRKVDAAEVLLPEENIHELNFTEIIGNAIAEHDFRRAIRYLYLLSLKELTDRKFIYWEPGKTNDTYIRELKSQLLKSHLEKNTYLYEHIWYGNFQMDEARFQSANQSFQSFIQNVKNSRE